MRTEFEDQGLWCLEGAVFFRDLSPTHRNGLRRIIKDVEYKSGQSIYLPGDPSDALYLLKEGKVKLSYLDESGKRLTLFILQSGQLFGEMALSEGRTRNLMAETLTDVTLCMFHRVDFIEFLNAYPELALKVIKLMGQRRYEIEQKIEDLIFRSIPARLARLLLKLAREFGEPFNGWKRLTLRLTHYELANLIGATRESTTAEVNRFEEMGLISRGLKKHIVILDEEKLKAVASV